MHPALTLCACGHEMSAHLDFTWTCDGAPTCDCTIFVAQADARKFGGVIDSSAGSAYEVKP